MCLRRSIVEDSGWSTSTGPAVFVVIELQVSAAFWPAEQEELAWYNHCMRHLAGAANVLHASSAGWVRRGKLPRASGNVSFRPIKSCMLPTGTA